MSRKQGRKDKHRQPKSHAPTTAQGLVPPTALPIDAKTLRVTNEHHSDSEKEGPATMPRKTDLMTIFTGVLAAFAVFSFIALWVQVQDARHMFAKDRRPFIWVTSNGLGTPEFLPLDNTKLPPTGQVVWDWHYTNYGKTPAFNVNVHHYMSIDGGPFIESYRAPREGSIGPPIPPTQDLFATVVSEPGLTSDQIAHAKSINGKGISIRIEVKYTDADGEKYESGICLLRLNTGATAYCPNQDENFIK